MSVKEKTTILAIRVKRTRYEITEWMWTSQKDITRYDPGYKKFPTEAYNYKEEELKNLVKDYQYLLDEYGEGNVEVVNTVVEITLMSVNLNEEKYLEERRRVALDKLSKDDIKALGLEQLAVYNKLKFHEAKNSKR